MEGLTALAFSFHKHFDGSFSSVCAGIFVYSSGLIEFDFRARFCYGEGQCCHSNCQQSGVQGYEHRLVPQDEVLCCFAGALLEIA